MTRRVLGLKSKTVVLRPYSEEWPLLFRREAVRLREALGRRVAAIEHIGSTAVPGLPAKPIVDIAVRLRPNARPPAAVRALGRLGYVYKGEYGLPGRHFFILGRPATHHVHVVVGRSRHWDRWLRFRTKLLGDARLRGRYRRLKEKMARRFAHDRAAYTASKDPFIELALKTQEPRKARKTRT
jgi:GrpB-like predicted nucleotidyltransferase (UPF0157 family)